MMPFRIAQWHTLVSATFYTIVSNLSTFTLYQIIFSGFALSCSLCLSPLYQFVGA